MTGTDLTMPRDARGLLAVPALALAMGFAGVYNGPLDELPLLLWCFAALMLFCWLTPAGAEDAAFAPAVLATCALIWCAVAWRASVSPAISLAPTVSLAIIPVAFLGLLGRRDHLLAFLVALTAAIALLLLGVLDLLSPAARPRGLLDPNNLATLANLVWPPALFVLVRWRGGEHAGALALAALLTALTAFLITAAGSRAAGALALVLTVFAVVLLRARALRLILAAGAGAAVGVVVGVVITLSAQDAAPGVAGEVGRGVSIRAQLALAAMELWAGAPVTGTGPQTFSLLYPAVRDPLELRTAGYFAHNDWLQLPQELGVPALLGLVAVTLRLLVVHLLGGLRVVKAASGVAVLERPLLAAALLAVLAHAVVNFTLYVAPIGLLFGLGLARVELLARTCEATPIIGAPRGRLVRRSGLVLATALLGPLAIDSVSAVALMGHRGVPMGETLSMDARLTLARQLQVLSPDDSVPPLFLAEHHRRAALETTAQASYRYELALAIQYFERALARDRFNTDVHRRYASLATAIGGTVPLPEAATRSDVELLAAARRLQPQDPSLVIALGRLHAERGDVDAERALLEAWLPWCALASRRAAPDSDAIRRRAVALAVDPARLALCPESFTAS